MNGYQNEAFGIQNKNCDKKETKYVNKFFFVVIFDDNC